MQGHPCHPDLCMVTTVWSRTINRLFSACIMYLFRLSSQGWLPQWWLEREPWYSSEKGKTRSRATAREEAFNTVARWRTCSMQRDFSLVMMKNISVVTNTVSFNTAVDLRKEETTSRPCSFSLQSRILCDLNELKCMSPWGKQQRNMKLS